MAYPYLHPYPHLKSDQSPPIALDLHKLLGQISDAYDRTWSASSECALDTALRIGAVMPHKPHTNCLSHDLVDNAKSVCCDESSPLTSRDSRGGLVKRLHPVERTTQNTPADLPRICTDSEHTHIVDFAELLSSRSPLERLECIAKHELKKTSKRRHQRRDDSAAPTSNPGPVACAAREHIPSVDLAKTDKPLPPLPPKYLTSAPHRDRKDYYKQVDSILAKARQKRDEREQGQVTRQELAKTHPPTDYHRNPDYELHHLHPLILLPRAPCVPVYMSRYHDDTSDSDVLKMDGIAIDDTSSSPCDNSAAHAGCNISGSIKHLVEKIPNLTCSCSGSKECDGGECHSRCAAVPLPSPLHTILGGGKRSKGMG